MKKEIAKIWSEALRSGKYKKGTYELRSNDGKRYCPAGVLCDLHDPNLWYLIPGNNKEVYYLYCGRMGTLPHEVMNWSGVKTEHIEIGIDCITDLSDGGKSFKKIAEIIDKNYKEL